MMPDNSSCWACHGEIDLVEMINGDGNVQRQYHYSTNAAWCEENAKLGCTIKSSGNCTAGACGNDLGARDADMHVPTFSSAYHEYAVEFDGSSHVSFAYDGKVIANITRASRGHGANPLFTDVLFYLILSGRYDR